jgi:molecular chaperone HtpG
MPDHFFEVELRGIVRHGNDLLLDPNAIRSYLSQTAPLSFSPSFKMGKEINANIDAFVSSSNLDLHLEGHGQVYRPYQDDFKITENLSDSFSELEFVRVPALDGTLGAIGWILHHGYKGAIPTSTNFRGLRVRVGNIQVGGSSLLEELFAEPRFNAWTVGEIHVLDSRVVPNGRRDHFEQNVHYLNLLNHLSPVAREISKRCRTSSLQRNWIRQFGLRKGVVRGKIALLKQGSVGLAKRSRVLSEAQEAVIGMEKIAAKEALPPEVRRNLAVVLKRIQTELTNIGQEKQQNALSRMRGPKRKAYEQVIGLIYECSQNESVAKVLVDRILARLTKG